MRARRLLKRDATVVASAVPAARSRPCVVHVVRAVNGEAPFLEFVEAMREHPPGIDCELVLALKGFRSPADAAPYLERAQSLRAEVMFFPDAGFDLGVYFAVASRLGRDRYCFLNSFSEPLVEGWLARLDAALRGDDVGIAGATGSWTSSRAWVLYSLHLPSPYRQWLPQRALVSEQFGLMDAERAAAEPAPAAPQQRRSSMRKMARTAIGGMRAAAQLPTQFIDFEPFPAHHLRTNAFMISHSTLAAMRLHEIRKKSDAYRLESGRESLTRQVQSAGLRAVVVDREGQIYDHEEWPESRTFFQGSQQGLLVADNQTRSYERGGPDRRRLLSAMAWGGFANPEL